MKLTRFQKIRRDQLTQATLYNRIAKGIRAAEKKNERNDGLKREGKLKR